MAFSALDCARREASSSGGKRSDCGRKAEVEGVVVGLGGVEGFLVGFVLFTSAVGSEGAGVLEGWV